MYFTLDILRLTKRNRDLLKLSSPRLMSREKIRATKISQNSKIRLIFQLINRFIYLFNLNMYD